MGGAGRGGVSMHAFELISAFLFPTSESKPTPQAGTPAAWFSTVPFVQE